jgi:hypothetical protein
MDEKWTRNHSNNKYEATISPTDNDPLIQTGLVFLMSHAVRWSILFEIGAPRERKI